MRSLTTMPRLNDLRRNKQAMARELVASLSPSQRSLFETVARGGTVFGGTGSDDAVVCKTRKDDGEVVEAMTDVRALVKHGWLRFAEMTKSGSGWYWMTDASERVWNVFNQRTER